MLFAVRTSILGAAFIALAPQLARANNAGALDDAADEVAELHCVEHERLVLWATGDLNGDGRQDLATIVERQESTPEEKEDVEYAPRRLLKLYLRAKQGHLAESGTFTRAISAQVWSWRYQELLRGMHITPDGTLVVMRWGDETYNTSEFTDHFRRSGKGWFYIGGHSVTASCTGSDCERPPESIVERFT